MEFINGKTIKLDKVVNEIDRFVLKFVKILKKHVDYVIVSGYVAILLGRNRATDDVDIIISRIDKARLSLLYENLIKEGYWCLNSSKIDDLYDILISKHSIRFAVEPNVSPNVEIKFSKDVFDEISLKSFIITKINDAELKAGLLELQVAYKEEVLKSNKDLEDARYLRLVARGHLDGNLVNKYKKQLRGK